MGWKILFASAIGYALKMRGTEHFSNAAQKNINTPLTRYFSANRKEYTMTVIESIRTGNRTSINALMRHTAPPWRDKQKEKKDLWPYDLKN
ncbi:hypothetical protein LJC41_00845 [Desulfosarcina sp. OttesenSCG-928-G17]|nr:hypothetical protein [Desulfosarcina sp. OttesenSCG-928-G17]